MVNQSPPIDSFEQYVLEVAHRTHRDGMSTSRIDTYQFLLPTDTWGFPKHPGRTVILSREGDFVCALTTFIVVNKALLIAPDAWLGTWIHPHTGDYYLDITTSAADLAEARQVAYANSIREGRQIIALYNAYRQETVYLEPSQ